MKTKMKISIIIPAYNEEKRICRTLEEYGNFFKNLKNKKFLDFEILVVLNGCVDRTEEIVKKYCKKYKEIKYLNFKQAGKGFAIIEGFREALKSNADLIGFVDADMATSPEAYYDLVENINRYDGIIASRWINGAKVTNRALTRRSTSNGFNFVVRALFLIPYRDTQCGAKLFKRKVVEGVIYGLNLTQWAFDVNLLYLCRKHNFKIKEYPTVWEDKEGSGITDILRISFQMFLGIIRLRLINSFFEPLLRQIKFILKIGNKIFNKR